MYLSTKTYGHEEGFSVAFRQWRAQSHCSKLHGYALKIKFTFAARDLDERNWVADFGGFKTLKEMLRTMFDHTTLVAADDPELEWFKQAHEKKILSMVLIDSTGCEKFAELVYNVTEVWMQENGLSPRVKLVAVEVAEHGANSAVFSIGAQ